MAPPPDSRVRPGLPPPVQALVARLLVAAGGGLHGDAVRAALATAPPPAALLEPLLCRRADDYTRNLLYRGDAFELLAMLWAPGCASTIHDHAGQRCWLFLLVGTLLVEGFDLASPADRGRAGPHRGLRRRPEVLRLVPGALDVRGPGDDIHRIINPAASAAISLHVYARPIDACLAYDPTAPLARQRRLVYDS